MMRPWGEEFPGYGPRSQVRILDSGTGGYLFKRKISGGLLRNLNKLKIIIIIIITKGCEKLNYEMVGLGAGHQQKQ
jgi:hypothetical protein